MAHEIEYIDNHVERALDLLCQQFRDKEKIADLIEAVVLETQEVEDAFRDLYLYRSLGTAFGQQLDGLGQILGLARQGMGDEEYRVALKFQAILNASKGQPEILILALTVFTKSDDVAVWEIYPAMAYGWFSNPDHIPPDLDDRMQGLCAGGVKWGGGIIGNEQPFVFDEGYTIPPDDVTLYGSMAIVDAANNLIDDGTQGMFSIAT